MLALSTVAVLLAAGVAVFAASATTTRAGERADGRRPRGVRAVARRQHDGSGSPPAGRLVRRHGRHDVRTWVAIT